MFIFKRFSLAREKLRNFNHAGLEYSLENSSQALRNQMGCDDADTASRNCETEQRLQWYWISEVSHTYAATKQEEERKKNQLSSYIIDKVTFQCKYFKRGGGSGGDFFPPPPTHSYTMNSWLLFVSAKPGKRLRRPLRRVPTRSGSPNSGRTV